MKRTGGFTLIELLVVIGILTILASISVPNYLNAQVRAKVARAHADMRTMAGALEAYKVDRNSYPCAGQNGLNEPINALKSFTRAAPGNFFRFIVFDSNGCALACFLNNNDAIIMATYHTRLVPAACRPAFSVDPGLRSITTPVAYIASYPADPFADTQGLSYGYVNMRNRGWMLWSFGPDCDESDGGEIGEARSKTRLGYSYLTPPIPMNLPQGDTDDYMEGRYTWSFAAQCADSEFLAPKYPMLYDPERSLSLTTLLVAGFTYDATNGSGSGGDLWRVK